MIITVIAVSLIGIVCSQDHPSVNIKYGAVEGRSIPIHTGQLIDSYLAIPFARAPIDELRFQPPQEPEPWNETLIADNIGNACYQPLVSTVQLTHFGYTEFDEDCLHLNVYTPQRDETDLLPVLVWIHGGGFQGGANFIYPGYFVAAKDVVVVTINYRLGILGFASTEDEVVPGNMGLLDQIQALRFVQENIAAFGGDPNRVTIVGESAGAASVGYLLMSPLAEGLFHGAILQSGNELCPWALHGPEQNPRNYLEQVAEQFDCPLEPSTDMVECLQGILPRPLFNAEYNCTEGYDCGGFRPVIDGTLLPDHPMELRRRGEYNKVPEMIGLNEDDSSIFVWGDNLWIVGGLNRTDFDDLIDEQIDLNYAKWPDMSRAEDVDQAVRWFYADWPNFEDPENNRYMLQKLETDSGFGWAADLQAKMHSDDVPAYFYIYDYMAENSPFPDFLGTFHGTEILQTFGWTYVFLEENELALNHSQINTYDVGYTDNDREVTEYIMTLWTNFVKYSDPTPEPVGPVEGPAIMWPQLTRDNLTYAYLGQFPEVRKDYRQQFYAFWTDYLAYLIYDRTFEREQDFMPRKKGNVERPREMIYHTHRQIDDYASILFDLTIEAYEENVL